MLHEIHEKRLQTKTKGKNNNSCISLVEVTDGKNAAMLLCTFKANIHVYTYEKQIYALTCEKTRKIPLFWTCILPRCLVLSLS